MAEPLKVSVLLEAIAETVGFEKFKQKLEETEIASKKYGSTMAHLKEGMMWAGGAAVVAGGLIVEASHASIEYAEATYNAARAANISTDAFQVLGHVARSNGSNIDQLARGMEKLQIAAADAAHGNSEMVTKFARLGISAGEFAKLRPEEQMERLGRAINGSNDQQEALAATMQLIGEKNAPALMASLRELGANGYAEVAEQAKKAGLVMSTEMTQRLAEANDRIEEFKNKLTIFAGKFVDIGLEIEDNLKPLNQAIIRAFRADPGTMESMRAQLQLAHAYMEVGNAAEAAKAAQKADPDGLLAGRKPLSHGYAAIQKDYFETLRGISALEEENAKKSAGQVKTAEADKQEAMRATIEQAIAGEEKKIEAERKAQEKAMALGRASSKEWEDATKRHDEEISKDRVEQAKRLQDAIDAVEHRGVNDYQKRGLSLGGVSALTFNPMPIHDQTSGAKMREVVDQGIKKQDSAGKEDKTHRILESIDATLKRVAAKEHGVFL